MKKNVLILMIFVLLMFIFSTFYYSLYSLLFIGIAIICFLTLASVLKNVGFYIVISLAYIYFTFTLFICEFGILNIISVILLVLYFIYCSYYVFNLFNNSMNIQFDSIKIPEDKEYLVVNYINGPIEDKNTNGLLVLDDNEYNLSIENNNKEVKTFGFFKEDIKETIIEEKPYMKFTNAYNNYETDYMKSYNIGRYTGSFDKSKSFKIIPSYHIKITLKDNKEIYLISFNKPNIF